MNMTRILAFKNKPPTHVEFMPQDYASVHQSKPVKPRKHIRQRLWDSLQAIPSVAYFCGDHSGLRNTYFDPGPFLEIRSMIDFMIVVLYHEVILKSQEGEIERTGKRLWHQTYGQGVRLQRGPRQLLNGF
ncbi:uncharacterized protein [Spinacia oleracea]|uniref:Uncharacterized protein isoform X2 n=1 Tax=Spinacia oleracea TaxID=3562 RepID=A0ABM3QNJ4_SPIOL|nr:uncharacterized protein LOC130461053 isoform X2 [Spinacia oleracea]